MVRRSTRITMKAAGDAKKVQSRQGQSREFDIDHKLKSKVKREPPETVSSSSNTGDLKPAANEEQDDFFPPRPKKERLERSKPRGFLFCPEPNCTKQYHFKWRIEQHILEVS